MVRQRDFGLRRLLASLLVGIALMAAPAFAGQGFRLLKIEGSHVKWGTPRLGEAATATYAMADGFRRFEDARNCGTILPITSVLEAARLTPAEFERELHAAFAMWEQVAAIDFRPAADPSAADILIGAQAQVVRWSWAMADVALETDGSAAVRTVRRGLVCINPDRPWHRMRSSGEGMGALRYALAHEIGHIIGLDHPGPTGALMSFRFDERAPGLLPGDIVGAVTLYGRPRLGSAPLAALGPIQPDPSLP